jgi:cyclase
MLRPRVIPVLLLKGRGFYKTKQFRTPVYVGDPINTFRIFCEKEVDEIVVLDIEATNSGRGPRLDVIGDMASECFMPMAYGGGVRTVEQARSILKLGVEKIVLNSAAVEEPEVISRVADLGGSSSVVVSIDAKKKLFGGYDVYIRSGTKKTRLDPVTLAKQAEQLGAGEILINSIDRDGMMEGYDLTLVEQVASAVNIPVVACGGCGSLADIASVMDCPASAAAAGSFFVFQGRHRAVLISYPSGDELAKFAERKQRALHGPVNVV